MVDSATGKDSFSGIPMPFVILIVVAAIAWVALHWSVYGRYLFAIGRNEEAARFSGINTRRVVTSAYVISGLLAGVSGIVFAFYTNSVSPSTYGNFYELYGIAAAVLGGCSLRGGEGSILGIVIGTAILQVLQNLVNLLGIPSSLNFAVMGAVVLVGVLADQLLQNRARKRLARARS
jgi:ribose transport system permease protein